MTGSYWIHRSYCNLLLLTNYQDPGSHPFASVLGISPFICISFIYHLCLSSPAPSVIFPTTGSPCRFPSNLLSKIQVLSNFLNLEIFPSCLNSTGSLFHPFVLLHLNAHSAVFNLGLVVSIFQLLSISKFSAICFGVLFFSIFHNVIRL